MAATAAMIADLRRMIDEAGTDTYSDETLTAIIEKYPVKDYRGEEMMIERATPLSWIVNPYWTPTYDLAAAAGQVWSEKATKLASAYDFTTQSQDFKRSQAYTQAMGQARYWMSRRQASTVRLWMQPRPGVYDTTVTNDSDLTN